METDETYANCSHDSGRTSVLTPGGGDVNVDRSSQRWTSMKVGHMVSVNNVMLVSGVTHVNCVTPVNTVMPVGSVTVT